MSQLQVFLSHSSQDKAAADGIVQGLLDVPADELATQVVRYVRTHAPPGWIEAADDTDADRSAQPYSGVRVIV